MYSYQAIIEKAMKFFKAGINLKIARIKAGLRQYEVARLVGIAPPRLSEIEAGLRQPSPELLKRIRKVFHEAQKAKSKA